MEEYKVVDMLNNLTKYSDEVGFFSLKEHIEDAIFIYLFESNHDKSIYNNSTQTDFKDP